MSDNKSVGGIRGGLSTEIQASLTIRAVLADIATNGFSRQAPFVIGKIEPELKSFAREHSIDLGGNDIVMTTDQIGHTLRDTKARDGKTIPSDHLAEFPIRRSGMELYHDKTNNNFIYFDRTRKEKFVVHPNYSMKVNREKVKKVNYLTASMTNPREFGMQKYTKIRPKRNG